MTDNQKLWVVVVAAAMSGNAGHVVSPLLGTVTEPVVVAAPGANPCIEVLMCLPE